LEDHQTGVQVRDLEPIEERNAPLAERAHDGPDDRRQFERDLAVREGEKLGFGSSQECRDIWLDGTVGIKPELLEFRGGDKLPDCLSNEVDNRRRQRRGEELNLVG
jgi:hypothetical protein